jgi:Ala-tRNA(Pro) deacylase
MALCERLKHFLDREQARYEVVPHAQVFTAQEVAATSHVTGWHLAKVLVLRDAEGRCVLGVVPAPARADIPAIESASGRRGLRLAREDEFRALFPDCETGTMPPFGGLYGLPLYLDASLARSEEFLFQGGTHEEVVRMRYADYQRLAQPVVGEFSLHEPARSDTA